MLKELRLTQTNRDVGTLKHWAEEYGDNGLLLNPPYQRGDVWGSKRRVNLIRSVLMCVPIPSMIINERLFAEWPDGDARIAVIDGKQRITTLLMFVRGEFAVPGGWFGLRQKKLRFQELSQSQQRRFLNRPLAFSEGRLPSVEAEREVFDLVNFGGLRQGEVDTDVDE